MKRIAIGFLAFLLIGSQTACAGRSASPEEKLLQFLRRTENLPRAYVYTEKVPTGPKVEVRGEIEDDLRAHALLTVDSSDVIEEYIDDDAIVVRVADPSQVPQVATPQIAGSQSVGDTLRAGQWVLDPSGAPPVLAPRSKDGLFVVGQNFVLDSIYAFQYFRRSITEAFNVREFDKDALDYFPTEDPFDVPDKNSGIKRYDLVAPALPRRSARGTEGALPGISHFRKMSFYIRDDKVVRIVEQIDFESHRDFKRAKEGKGPKYSLQLLAAVRAGQGREPIRPRFMSYEISRLGDEDLKIEAPEPSLTAPLKGIFGPQAAPDAPEEESPTVATETVTSNPPSG